MSISSSPQIVTLGVLSDVQGPLAVPPARVVAGCSGNAGAPTDSGQAGLGVPGESASSPDPEVRHAAGVRAEGQWMFFTSLVESQQVLPDLRTLIQSDRGMADLFHVYVTSTVPDWPADAQPRPARRTHSARWS